MPQRNSGFSSFFNISPCRSINSTFNEREPELGDATDKLRREFDRGDSSSENKQYVRNCLSITARLTGLFGGGISARKPKEFGRRSYEI